METMHPSTIPVATALNAIHLQDDPTSRPTTTMGQLATRQFLDTNNWPLGLQNALIGSCESFPKRYFVVDNSGSMLTADGHQLFMTSRGPRALECSRWAELKSTMRFHGQLAHLLQAESEFRLLNGCDPINIGHHSSPSDALELLNARLEEGPQGRTPLCRHIGDIIADIRTYENALRVNHQRAVVIIATDGEATDGSLVEAMKPLRSLPVWVVVRLCTDDDDVVSYWNDIDSQLEVDMDVLDDLFGEAVEVRSGNNWLTYGEPLHRLREWGVHMRELDLIDSSPLSLEDMRTVCCTLLGSELPHPGVEWELFLREVTAASSQVEQICDPLKLCLKPWVRFNKLVAQYRRVALLHDSHTNMTCVVM